LSYQATVLPVMIASPGDVNEERNIVRNVLHEWNDIHAAHRSVVFLPIGWDSNSSPELGARPQSQINDRILKACDLLIGIFWTRGMKPSGTRSCSKRLQVSVSVRRTLLSTGLPEAHLLSKIWASTSQKNPRFLDSSKKSDMQWF